MVIVSQKENVLYNLSQVTKIYRSSNNKLMVSVTSGEGGEIAEYKTSEQCAFAIGMLAAAVQGEERMFQFPLQEEMQRNVQHRSNVSAKNNRHGGS